MTATNSLTSTEPNKLISNNESEQVAFTKTITTPINDSSLVEEDKEQEEHQISETEELSNPTTNQNLVKSTSLRALNSITRV